MNPSFKNRYINQLSRLERRSLLGREMIKIQMIKNIIGMLENAGIADLNVNGLYIKKAWNIARSGKLHMRIIIHNF